MAGDERLEEEGELSVVPRKPPYMLSRKNVKDSMDKFGTSLNDINSQKVLQQCPKVNGSSSSSSHHPHLLPSSLPNTTTTSSESLKNHNKNTATTFNSDTAINHDNGESAAVADEEAEVEGNEHRSNLGSSCGSSASMAKCSSRGVDPDSMDHLHHPLSRTNKLSRLNLQQTLAVLADGSGSVGSSGGVLEDDDEEEGDDENMDSDFDDEERPLSSLMESNDNKEEKCAGSRMRKNKRRTLRFHSSESSDSGVAALSSTDSSQSSGTSDITEPCSPPSPVSPPSDVVALHHHDDHDNDHGFEVTNSPPSCLGSYDSGVEEAPSSQSPDPRTPSDSSSADQKDDQNFEEHQVLEEEYDLFTGEEVVCLDSSGKCQSFSEKCEKVSVENGDKITIKTELREEIVSSFGSDVIEEGTKDKTMVCVKEISSTTANTAKSGTATTNGRERVKNDSGIEVQTLVETSEVCHWTKCFQVLPTGSDMIEHMRSAHVDAQVNSESFVCLWEGCKVYNRASCSLSWLERHVLTHSGTKPFKCIVEGCGQRFTSQNALERHVNSHFNQQQNNNSNANGKRSHDTTPSKIVKKKKLRYKKSLWTARNDDFFDAGIMEMVRHQLMMASSQTRLDLDGSSNSVTFQSTVIARQVEPSGQVRMLLHWVPENIIPDEWVFESQVLSSSKQTIPLSSLPRDALEAFDTPSPYYNPCYRRKSRRK